VRSDEAVPGHILRLVDDIAPAVLEVENKPGDAVDNAVRANVRRTARLLETSVPVLRPMVRKGKLKVVAAYYDLATGKVELLGRK
jgi:carbonic anhydrase